MISTLAIVLNLAQEADLLRICPNRVQYGDVMAFWKELDPFVIFLDIQSDSSILCDLI